MPETKKARQASRRETLLRMMKNVSTRQQKFGEARSDCLTIIAAPDGLFPTRGECH
jgi:hypothetical protein